MSENGLIWFGLAFMKFVEPCCVGQWVRGPLLVIVRYVRNPPWPHTGAQPVGRPHKQGASGWQSNPPPPPLLTPSTSSEGWWEGEGAPLCNAGRLIVWVTISYGRLNLLQAISPARWLCHRPLQNQRVFLHLFRLVKFCIGLMSPVWPRAEPRLKISHKVDPIPSKQAKQLAWSLFLTALFFFPVTPPPPPPHLSYSILALSTSWIWSYAPE